MVVNLFKNFVIGWFLWILFLICFSWVIVLGFVIIIELVLYGLVFRFLVIVYLIEFIFEWLMFLLMLMFMIVYLLSIMVVVLFIFGMFEVSLIKWVDILLVVCLWECLGDEFLICIIWFVFCFFLMFVWLLL